MAKNRNDFTAPNMSIEKPHKAVPIPHPTPRNRLFTPPKKQNKIKMACLVRWLEDLETGRLEEDDLLSIPSFKSVTSQPPSPPHPWLGKMFRRLCYTAFPKGRPLDTLLVRFVLFG